MKKKNDKPTESLHPSLRNIKPIEGFHVMEFIRKARKEIARETRGMTPEQRAAHFAAMPKIFQR